MHSAPGILALLLTLSVTASVADAQIRVRWDGRADLHPGSDAEVFLRVLTLRDSTSGVPWTTRALSPMEIDALVNASRARSPTQLERAPERMPERIPAVRGTLLIDIATPVAAARFNSAFPFGSDDGAVWAGRGTTAWTTFGATLRAGPASLGIHPVAWRTSNASFPLAFEGAPAPLRYADALHPTTVDRPQRFGDGAVGRVDAGNSFFRLDSKLLSLGASTAPEAWGPASFFPFLLGTNAPGFPHLFASSGMPWNLYVAKLHAKVIYGRLTESPYAFRDSLNVRERFASGLVFGVGFPVLPGLEVGLGRFFHTPLINGRRPSRADYLKPFEGLLKRGLTRVDDTGEGDFDNQLASVFGTWRFPSSAAELYFEFGREDHSYDFRDLLLEPDHTGTRLYGLRKSWNGKRDALWSLRAETFGAEATQAVRVRAEGATFLGTAVRQGHTQRGQLLAADVGPGSAAAQSLSVDRYANGGRTGMKLTRKLRSEARTFQATAVPDPRLEVQYSLEAEAMRRAMAVDITLGIAGVHYTRRNLQENASGVSLWMALRPRSPVW